MTRKKIQQSAIAACVFVLCSQLAPAQRTDTQPAPFFGGQYVTVDGERLNSSSPADTPVYRPGTDPLVQITDVNGDPLTWGQVNTANGTMTITELAGGGTSLTADMEGLIPGELYSFWAGYFDPFPMNRSTFGAITENGLGTDHYARADAEGKLSMTVVQQAGPGTVEGAFLPYAPDWATGYDVGLALHFGDDPRFNDDPMVFLSPGPESVWALATVTHFPTTVPEPSSIALIAIAGCALIGRVRRK